MNPNVYIISEFGYIRYEEKSNNENNDSYLSCNVQKEAYLEFEEFAKTEQGSKLLKFSANGKSLQAQNYIGVIHTKSNYTLEILPKTLNFDKKDNQDNIKNAKYTFIKLLHILYKLPNEVLNNKATLDTYSSTNIFEIFIKLFLDQVGVIINNGIKLDYVQKEDNANFLKGKLLHHQNIKYNSINKHKFYIQYDEYNPNRPENRLIKVTLLLLLKYSNYYNNLRLIRLYIEHMYMIEPSQNINHDLKLINFERIGRGMEHYRYALIWARVFLKKETFSHFSNNTISFAILYPMEKLFESFVGWWLKKSLKKQNLDYTIKQQSNDFIENLLVCKPDFIIKDSEKNTISIADAKWKILNDENDISISDMYQLFAYQKVFTIYNSDNSEDNKIPKLQIIYPKPDNNFEFKEYTFFDDSKIKFTAIDLEKELSKYQIK